MKFCEDRLRAWVFLRVIISAQWFIEDNGNPDEMLRLASVLYLKWSPEMFSKEPKIIRFLDEHSNACVPQVIAENSQLNCFLMKNAGQTLRETLNKKFSEELLFRTIEQFTCLQSDITEHIDALLEMGVPDYRLKQLPDLYTQLIKKKDLLLAEGLSELEIKQLSELACTVCELCKKLSRFQIKQTIVQSDFNDNNTLIDETNQKTTIIDLGEVVISHPFFSLLNFLYQMKKHHGLSEKDDLYIIGSRMLALKAIIPALHQTMISKRRLLLQILYILFMA